MLAVAAAAAVVVVVVVVGLLVRLPRPNHHPELWVYTPTHWDPDWRPPMALSPEQRQPLRRAPCPHDVAVVLVAAAAAVVAVAPNSDC